MSLSAGSTGLPAVRDFTPQRSPPAHAGYGHAPLGPWVSSLSDVPVYSSKFGVKDGAVSPNFSAAALHFASRKNRFLRLQAAFRGS